ncbi:hypothetical protein ACFP2T_13410 [Plantactinospora solaniradicis]|uniref:Uncharacterized protein n=1 Tax=Plantactinospora solaniradicis TaxID=1723736 RepID=A0ABW1K696_9ACTN
MLTIAAEQVDRGWGGPIGLLAAVAVFWGLVEAHRYFKIRNSSPTAPADDTDGINPLVDEVSDTDDTDRDTSWWGRIVDRDGRRVRQIEHVLRTGSSLPDDEIDLALDDEDPHVGTSANLPETQAEFVDRLDLEGVPYAEIVRQAMERFRISEATVKRRIREVREVRNR